MAVTLFTVTLREPPTASEDLQKVINKHEPVVGRQKCAKVLPTGAQHLLLGFGQEQQEQGHHCRSDSRMDVTGDKTGDKVGLRCTPEQRQVQASPPRSLGTTGAGMSLSSAPGPGVPQDP